MALGAHLAHAAAASPQDADYLPPKRVAARSGYAMDRPEILLRQRLFGLAHGATLLATGCQKLPDHADASKKAYVDWHRRQKATIKILIRDLAHYHFDSGPGRVQWMDLAQTLGLKDSIAPALREVSLEDACATFPQALASPRYALDKLLNDASVPPAPTFATPPTRNEPDRPKPSQ